MEMRMRELAEVSGLAKTTIHHYIREGLLPPAIKSARNAALYGPQHLERLELISQLRAEAGGELSIPQVRTVLTYSDQGVAAGPAARLAMAGVEPEAAAEGLSAEAAHALERAGLIVRGEGGGVSAGDVLVARACDALLQAGMEPEDLTPLADLLREVGIYANSLATLYATQADSGLTQSSHLETALTAKVRDLLDALLWRALET
jgi:DNA-binding transcriptional MerR regulator